MPTTSRSEGTAGVCAPKLLPRNVMQHVGGDAKARYMSAAALAEPAHVAQVAEGAHIPIAGVDTQAQHGTELDVPKRCSRCKLRNAVLVMLCTIGVGNGKSGSV